MAFFFFLLHTLKARRVQSKKKKRKQSPQSGESAGRDKKGKLIWLCKYFSYSFSFFSLHVQLSCFFFFFAEELVVPWYASASSLLPKNCFFFQLLFFTFFFLILSAFFFFFRTCFSSFPRFKKKGRKPCSSSPSFFIKCLFCFFFFVVQIRKLTAEQKVKVKLFSKLLRISVVILSVFVVPYFSFLAFIIIILLYLL